MKVHPIVALLLVIMAFAIVNRPQETADAVGEVATTGGGWIENVTIFLTSLGGAALILLLIGAIVFSRR